MSGEATANKAVDRRPCAVLEEKLFQKNRWGQFSSSLLAAEFTPRNHGCCQQLNHPQFYKWSYMNAYFTCFTIHLKPDNLACKTLHEINSNKIPQAGLLPAFGAEPTPTMHPFGADKSRSQGRTAVSNHRFPVFYNTSTLQR